MLVLSVAIFIGYVWPEIDTVKTINQQYITNASALKLAKDKQAAINQIGDQLKNDSDTSSLITTYLPTSKVEERIISGVNYLATDSGVSLVNMSLQDASADSQIDSSSSPAVAAAPAIAEPVAAMPGAADVPVAAPAASSRISDVKLSEARITVNGEYDKLRIYFDQLERMPLYKTIKSLDIKQAAAQDGGTSSTLSADLVVDFGYIAPVKVNSAKLEAFKPGLDMGTISDLKNFTSQKIPAVNASGAGKTNPFLP